jgi:hypothetical protein
LQIPSCKWVRGAGAATIGTVEDPGTAAEDDSGKTAAGVVHWSETISGSRAKDTSVCGIEDDVGGDRGSLTSIRPGEAGIVEGSTGSCARLGTAGWSGVVGAGDGAGAGTMSVLEPCQEAGNQAPGRAQSSSGGSHAAIPIQAIQQETSS